MHALLRLELTEEGRAFLSDARAIIASVEGAQERMAAHRERPSGRLRVDAATPFMLHVIVPLVQGYRERYPHVELELNTNKASSICWNGAPMWPSGLGH